MKQVTKEEINKLAESMFPKVSMSCAMQKLKEDASPNSAFVSMHSGNYILMDRYARMI